MTNAAREWIEVGTFDTVTAAKRGLLTSPKVGDFVAIDRVHTGKVTRGTFC
jgi:hypothetical protein